MYPLARQRPTSSGPCTNTSFKTASVPTYHNAEYSSTGRVSASNLISSDLTPKIRRISNYYNLKALCSLVRR
jgi:hypothetical protein